MNQEIFDLAIAGGGPAGTVAAATAASRGRRVVLLESGSVGRDKVCGEFVSAEALPLLEALTPELLAATPVISETGLWSSRGRHARFAIREPGRGISRPLLDAALWRAAQARGADCREHTRVEAVEAEPDAEDDTWQLRLSGGESLLARSVVVAAGRWWRIRGLESPASPRPRNRYIGMKARFAGLDRSTAVELYAFRAGYCGVTSVENGLTNVAALVDRRALMRPGCELRASVDFAAWLDRLAHHPVLRARLRPGTQATKTVITAPVAMGARPAQSGRILFAGDACGFIDPFTGDGIARAMLAGGLAGLCPETRCYVRALRNVKGYGLSTGLRAVMAAPEWVQAAALTAIRRTSLGPWLLTSTRSPLRPEAHPLIGTL